MSAKLLQRTLRGGDRLVSPFLILGDPTPARSVDLCVALVRSGAGMLELGIPYADPSADGPVVQAAGRRALSAGVSTDVALEVLEQVRAACPDTPLNLLVYGNLVHARGYDRFCRDAAAAGASSLLVPDIPLEEGEELRSACRAHGVGVVLLAGPRTEPARLRRIEAEVDAFVYLAGHQGITGAPRARDAQRRASVRTVRGVLRGPLCVGFGLTSAADVDSVHDEGAEIAVVGSALLRVLGDAIAAHPGDPGEQARLTSAAFRALLSSRGASCA